MLNAKLLALVLGMVLTLVGCVGTNSPGWQPMPATPTPVTVEPGEPTPTPGDNYFEVLAHTGEDEDVPAYWAQFFGTSATGDVIPAAGITIDGDFSWEYRSCWHYTASTCGSGLVIHGSISIPKIWEYSTGEGAYTHAFTVATYYPDGWFVGEISEWDPDKEKYQGMVIIGWALDDPALLADEWTSDNPDVTLNEFFGVLYYGTLEEIKSGDPKDAEKYLVALGQLILPRAK